MNVLGQRESQVYDMLRAGVSPNEIARQLGYRNSSSIYWLIDRLIENKFLERVKEGRNSYYRSLVEEYQVVSRQKLFNFRKTMRGLEPYYVDVPAETRNILLKRYETATRSELAQACGLPRYVINRELISMGLERKE